MKNEGSKKTGHSILSYKVRLYDRHFSWLENTRELYEKVVFHFFTVLAREENLLELSDFSLLRTLETKCIGTKEMKKAGISPDYPLIGFPKIPLYFRRSAINAAIDLVRKKVVSHTLVMETAGKDVRHIPMVFYQGMYREFQDSSVELKLFNGEEWIWVRYPFKGRTFPKEARQLSPILTLEKKTAWLEVPLSFPVEDIRTVKERMKVSDRICAVSVPDDEILAVAVILSKNGEELNYKIFKGGKQKEHQRRQILERIQKSRESRGIVPKKKTGQGKLSGNLPEGVLENRCLYQKLEEINNYYAHKVSRELLQYCMEQEIKVIVVPNYESGMDSNNLDTGSGKTWKEDIYRWIGRSIIKKLKYKAFQQGIVVTAIRPHQISNKCSECGTIIQRYNDVNAPEQNSHGGRYFVCPNGHKGSSARNTARNVGKRFLSYVQE